jgi:hypothetical protein
MLRTKYIFLLIILTFSCSSSDNNLYKYEKGDIGNSKITLSEIADSIFYIPLDDTIPIGVYYDTKIINNTFYISGKGIGLLSFNLDGQLQRKIGIEGRGPGEYLYCKSFDIDSIRGTVYILDMGRNIQVYAGDGGYIKEISIKKYEDLENTEFFADLNFYKDKLILSEYISMGVGKYNWIVIDTLGNLITSKINSVTAFKSNSWIPGGTYKFNNRIFYYNQYNDTVFSISPDLKCEASFLIGTGKERLPRAQFNEIDEWQNFIIIKSIFETRSWWVIYYSYKSKRQFALVNKKSKKKYLINERTSNKADISPRYLGGIINDLDGGVMFQPENYLAENNQEYLIELIPTNVLKTFLASDEFRSSVPRYPEKKKELEKLSNLLRETDNPILVLARLKK